MVQLKTTGALPDTTQIRKGMSNNTTCIYSDQQLTLYSFLIDNGSEHVCSCLWDIGRKVQSMYIQVSRSSYLNVAISLLTPSNSFFFVVRESEPVISFQNRYMILLSASVMNGEHEPNVVEKYSIFTVLTTLLILGRSPVTPLGQISSEELGATSYIQRRPRKYFAIHL